jgi:hypothetical protein
MTPEEMLRALEPRRPAGCPSDLALDRARAGEVDEAERARVQRHVDGCPRCAAHWQATDQAAHALPPRRIGSESPRVSPGATALRRRPWPRRAPGRSAALALAAAAAVWLVWARAGKGPASSGEGDLRSKGSARLGLFVKSGDRVRHGVDGEVVAPGDTLRFTVTATAERWVAVLSRDGGGTASLYVPGGSPGTPMIAVTAGHDVPLPGGLELDEILGREDLVGVFCDRPVPTGDLLRELRASGTVHPPAGCTVDRLTIDKRDKRDKRERPANLQDRGAGEGAQPRSPRP